MHFLFMIGLKHLLEYKITAQQLQIYIILGFAFVNNGFILQHGKYMSGQTATDEIRVTITYPISFPNNVVCFAGVCNDFSDILSIRNDTNTQFIAAIFERYSQYTVYANFWWIAIGY